MPHILLLVHPKQCPRTRTYTEYESMESCLDAVCQIYEEHLRRKSPDSPVFAYTINQLFAFIDSLVDICCLVYDKNTHNYIPLSKDWIKDSIYENFRKVAVDV